MVKWYLVLACPVCGLVAVQEVPMHPPMFVLECTGEFPRVRNTYDPPYQERVDNRHAPTLFTILRCDKEEARRW